MDEKGIQRGIARPKCLCGNDVASTCHSMGCPLALVSCDVTENNGRFGHICSTFFACQL